MFRMSELIKIGLISFRLVHTSLRLRLNLQIPMADKGFSSGAPTPESVCQPINWQNFREHQLLLGMCSVVFPAFTLKLPIQTLLSVAPTRSVFWRTTQFQENEPTPEVGFYP